jgi:hydroxymethylglutaryl-CoA lyase
MKIIECPRDAMQGIKEFISTEKKVNYINQILKVGFDTIDFGSFVSPRAIPQMKDTADVLKKLDLSGTKSKLLAIVANQRGAEDAADFEEITYLGYPLSASETFQVRNTNRNIEQALNDLQEIKNICLKKDKQLVCYISMGFGNPYDDPWSTEVVSGLTEKISETGAEVISLSDTVGTAVPEDVYLLFKDLTMAYPRVEFGVHFHSHPEKWRDKIESAYNAGCRRFDSAVKGFGGCPMAKDELVGNIATENLIAFFEEKNEKLGLDINAFQKAIDMAPEIFN